MFIVIYQFEVRTGQEELFVESWKTVTKAIYQHRGSGGSRLHKDASGVFLAYAQWPSQEQFEKDLPLPHEYWAVSDIMKDCCVSISGAPSGSNSRPPCLNSCDFHAVGVGW